MKDGVYKGYWIQVADADKPHMLTKDDGVAVHDIYPLAGVNYHFYIYFMNIRNIWRTDGPSEGSTAVEKRVDGSSYRGT